MPSHFSSKKNRFIRKKKKDQRNQGDISHERPEKKSQKEGIRINKYIAHSGYCSRRDADQLIVDGAVSVNGKVLTEPGVKIFPRDEVIVKGEKLKLERFTYILLHKPHNTITTTSDEKGRRTVMQLIENETGNRLYPVGRLDRDTTGVLLLTNDGDLANRLMHPSYEIRKTYELECKNKFTEHHVDQLIRGVELEDGLAKAYQTMPVDNNPKKLILSIHEGRNRQVRRMAEAIGQEVVRLKRIDYAGLNLKEVRPGRWRYLKQKEINRLRHMVKLKPLDFGTKKDA